jgi:hypothetical protein
MRKMKCPYCEYDLLLESKVFENVKDRLPKTRYLQAYVKYSKIKKLAEAKEYEGRIGNSGRIRDLIKDCLNDMEMALELKFGKRSKKNTSWEPWMHELADIRNHAIHKMTAMAIHQTIGNGKNETVYHLRAVSLKGKITETNEEPLPYLEKTLGKIKTKLGITEI